MRQHERYDGGVPAGRSPRLNLWQQAMVLWEDVHPYNNGAVIRLRGRADVARLRSAIETACHQAGVGRLRLDRERQRYRYESGGSIDVEEVDAGDSAWEALGRTVAAELNTPFPRDPHHPVRWKVLDDPPTRSHLLLAFFRHLTADEIATRLLLRRVLERYYGVPGEEGPLEVHPPRLERVMRHHYRRLGYLTTFVRAVRLYVRLRHVHRIPDVDGRGNRSQLYLVKTPDGLIGRLAIACRQQRTTVTAAFLAALAGALAEVTPARLRHPRRHGLAVGTVANVRGEASEDLSACLGVYLGQSITVIEAPDLADFESLLSRAGEALRREKEEKRFAGFPWNLWTLTRLGRWFSFKATRVWYRKVYPVSACLSNMRFDIPGFESEDDRILDCIQIASVGPVFPLLLAATTFGDRLNLAITYAESAFTRSEVCQLAEVFLARLRMLADGQAMPAASVPSSTSR